MELSHDELLLRMITKMDIILRSQGSHRQELAEKMGLADASIFGQIKRGKMSPSVRTLCRISTAMGIEPYELLTPIVIK